MGLEMELEDSFIDEDEVRKNVIDLILSTAKYRQVDGELYDRFKKRVAAIESLSTEEINFICSPETYEVFKQKKPEL